MTREHGLLFEYDVKNTKCNVEHSYRVHGSNVGNVMNQVDINKIKNPATAKHSIKHYLRVVNQRLPIDNSQNFASCTSSLSEFQNQNLIKSETSGKHGYTECTYVPYKFHRVLMKPFRDQTNWNNHTPTHNASNHHNR